MEMEKANTLEIHLRHFTDNATGSFGWKGKRGIQNDVVQVDVSGNWVDDIAISRDQEKIWRAEQGSMVGKDETLGDYHLLMDW